MAEKCYNIKKNQNKNKMYVEKTLKEFADRRIVWNAVFNFHRRRNGRIEHQLCAGFFSLDELNGNGFFIKFWAPWSRWRHPAGDIFEYELQSLHGIHRGGLRYMYSRCSTATPATTTSSSTSP